MTATTEGPEARLYAAGFTRQLDFWLSPDGHRVLNLDDAIAALDSGAINPAAGIEFPDSGASALPNELVDRICPSPQRGGEPPAWLVAQAEVIAEATVAKLRGAHADNVRPVASPHTPATVQPCTRRGGSYPTGYPRRPPGSKTTT
jgi:hypothetical protein